MGWVELFVSGVGIGFGAGDTIEGNINCLFWYGIKSRRAGNE